MLILSILIKMLDGYVNNLEDSSITKNRERNFCRHLMSNIWAFNNIGSKHTLHCGEDCMKSFCTFLRKEAQNVINFQK